MWLITLFFFLSWFTQYCLFRPPSSSWSSYAPSSYWFIHYYLLWNSVHIQPLRLRVFFIFSSTLLYAIIYWIHIALLPYIHISNSVHSYATLNSTQKFLFSRFYAWCFLSWTSSFCNIITDGAKPDNSFRNQLCQLLSLLFSYSIYILRKQWNNLLKQTTTV